MILMRSSEPSASKPHDNSAQREQNPHDGHYNGLIFTAGAAPDAPAWSGLRASNTVLVRCPGNGQRCFAKLVI